DPGSLRINNAIRAWLSVRSKTKRAITDADAFFHFKTYVEDNFTGTTKELLIELHQFCCIWAENYRYHAVKKYKSYDWASLGKKTLVSDYELKDCENEESRDYFQKHYNVNTTL
ncbi:MAG: hypothetical protein MJ189_05885, partial [Coriobacteriales bacterium]|nr:hypothetical protein [Coriobacteriales bacterium]